jgi:hypothetical protein
MAYEWETEQIENLFAPQSTSLEPVQSINEQIEASFDNIDNVMDEAEKRFEVAQHYKLLLQDRLFESQSDAAYRVEQEIRAFIKERLGVLLGIRQEKTQNDLFSQEQIAVLKQFADLGDDAPEVLKAVMGTLSKKIEKKSKPAAPPALKQVKEPAVQPSVVKKEEPKLKGRNQPVPNKQPESKPVQQLQRPAQQTQKREQKHPNVPSEHKDNPTLKVVGNKAFIQATNAQGELLWEKVDNQVKPMYKEVTAAAKPSGSVQPIPMPVGQQLSLITESQSSQVFQTVSQGENVILNQMKQTGDF